MTTTPLATSQQTGSSNAVHAGPGSLASLAMRIRNSISPMHLVGGGSLATGILGVVAPYFAIIPLLLCLVGLAMSQQRSLPLTQSVPVATTVPIPLALEEEAASDEAIELLTKDSTDAQPPEIPMSSQVQETTETATSAIAPPRYEARVGEPAVNEDGSFVNPFDVWTGFDN